MMTLDIEYIQTIINDLKILEGEFELLGCHDESMSMTKSIEVLEERIRMLQLCVIMCGDVEEEYYDD